MKKKINIRFIMIAALAIVVTALSAMLVYYNILKEQVFGDLKAYAHVIELLNIDDLAAGIEKDPYNPIDDDLRITLIEAEGEVLYERLLNKDEMDNHNERPEIIEAREKAKAKPSVTRPLPEPILFTMRSVYRMEMCFESEGIPSV